MASGIYGSFWDDVFKGNVDMDTDTFYVMAMTATYSENFDTHNRRDDITNEVSGTGYAAGGNSVTITLNAYDTVNNRYEITLGGTTWPSSTLSSVQKFAYYKRRGGASSADELIALIDNGAGVTTSNGTLTLNASTLRVTNPA